MVLPPGRVSGRRAPKAGAQPPARRYRRVMQRSFISAAGPGSGWADTVFSGGPVLTMDRSRPRAAAVAVTEGRIVAVGSTKQVAAWTGPGTEVVDLDGRALLSGFVDPHMHSAMVQCPDWVDVSPLVRPSAEEVFTALREAPPTRTGWVLAKQFDPTITGRTRNWTVRCSTTSSRTTRCWYWRATGTSPTSTLRRWRGRG